MTENTLNLM